MTRACYLICVGVFAFAFPGHGLTAQGSSTCPLADSTSAQLVADIVRIATGTDVIKEQLRQNRAIPQVSASKVVYVTDNTICAKALPVYNANTRTFNAITGAEANMHTNRLYVVKVGAIYLVLDPGATVGEFGRLLTLDSKYRVLARSLQ